MSFIPLSQEQNQIFMNNLEKSPNGYYIEYDDEDEYIEEERNRFLFSIIEETDFISLITGKDLWYVVIYLRYVPKQTKINSLKYVMENGFEYIEKTLVENDQYCYNYKASINKNFSYNNDIYVLIDYNSGLRITELSVPFFLKCVNLSIIGDISSYLINHKRMMGKLKTGDFLDYGSINYTSIMHLHKYILYADDVNIRFRKYMIENEYICNNYNFCVLEHLGQTPEDHLDNKEWAELDRYFACEMDSTKSFDEVKMESFDEVKMEEIFENAYLKPFPPTQINIENLLLSKDVFRILPYFDLVPEEIKKLFADISIENGYDYMVEFLTRTDDFCKNYIGNIKGIKYNSDIYLHDDEYEHGDNIIFLSKSYFCWCRSLGRNGLIDSYIHERKRMMGGMDISVFVEYEKYGGLSILRLHNYYLYGSDVNREFRDELISRGYIKHGMKMIWENLEYCCHQCKEIDEEYELRNRLSGKDYKFKK